MSLSYNVTIRKFDDGAWHWRVQATEHVAWNWERASDGRSWSGVAESFAEAAKQAAKRLQEMPGV